MFARVSDLFGIEHPIFAFSHCRDVVIAVSRSGGMGVLGAALLDDEELDRELTLIEKELGEIPYAVDMLVPSATAAQPTTEPGGESAVALPDEHVAFVERTLEELGAPPLAADSHLPLAEHRADVAERQAQIALSHRPTLLVSALGTPTDAIITAARARNVKVGALAGSVKHATRHAEAGLDIIIAQGGEAGGHTGKVATMVLVPDVVDAVAPIPVLAAGGIGTGRQMAAAEALGADGVWTGSIWLAAEESNAAMFHREAYAAASAEDTVVSRIRSGKTVRMLRSSWTEAWNRPDAPKPLSMGTQHKLVAQAHARLDALGDSTATPSLPVGQIVGRMNATRPAATIVYELVSEYVEAVERMRS